MPEKLALCDAPGSRPCGRRLPASLLEQPRTLWRWLGCSGLPLPGTGSALPLEPHGLQAAACVRHQLCLFWFHAWGAAGCPVLGQFQWWVWSRARCTWLPAPVRVCRGLVGCSWLRPSAPGTDSFMVGRAARACS